MDFEKYTEKARSAVQAGQAQAVRSHHQRFQPEHLLAALLEDEDGQSARLIEAAGGNAEAVLDKVEAALKAIPRVEGSGAGQVYLAPETARVFDSAEQLAKKAGDEYVTAERLLQAMAVQGVGALKSAGVTPQKLEAAIVDLRKGRSADSPTAENTFEALKKDTRDFTDMAREGRLD